MATMIPAGWSGSVGTAELRRMGGWFLVEGIILLLLGMVALGYDVLTTLTLATVVFFGWLLIFAGAVSAIHAFWLKDWPGFLMNLISGLLYLAIGIMVAGNPGVAAEALTLLIALFLIFGGLFRIGAAVSVRPPHWGWVLLNGVISLMLGMAIWRQWPLSGLWVIGLFVAIEMIFNGWSLIMLGLVARRLPPQPAE